MMRTLKYLAAVLALSACTPSPVLASPAPFGVALTMALDTVRVTARPCDADEPTVKCRVTVTGSVAGNPINFPALADVQVGDSIQVSATFTGLPLQVVQVAVTTRGVNRTGDLSAPFVVNGQAVIPDGAPNVPRSFTITITIPRP